LRRAYELGVRYFDTAPLYGYGLAEQREEFFPGEVLDGHMWLRNAEV
jgi:aryl-alcohol dehydrogenase-like predicted oxidoreductase